MPRLRATSATGATFVGEQQSVELELTRIAAAGGRHQTFLQGTKYVPYRGVYKTDSTPVILGAFVGVAALHTDDLDAVGNVPLV